jgi:hypothetical protein
MNPSIDGAGARRNLDAELRELGTALRRAPVPPADEGALLRAFRARQAAEPIARREARWRRAPLLASAAALVVSVATGALVLLTQTGRDVQTSAARSAPAAAAAAPSAFQPLMYSPGFSPTGSYSVVRVRIPLASLALGSATELDGVIEADLLVGEDGLASGIRFDAEDTLLVSTIAR